MTNKFYEKIGSQPICTPETKTQILNLAHEMNEVLPEVLRAQEHTARPVEEALLKSIPRGLLRIPDLKLQDCSSWAVWDEEKDAAGKKIRYWHEGRVSMKARQDADQRPPQHLVFLGLNYGQGAGTQGEAPSREPWSNFHGSAPLGGHALPRTQNIRPLARAVRSHADGVYVGAYMTDFYKEMPTSDGGVLNRALDAFGKDKEGATFRSRVKAAMTEMLRNELKIVEIHDPVFVTLGGATTKEAPIHLTEFDESRFVPAPHYTARKKQVEMAEAYSKSLSRVDEVLSVQRKKA